MKTIPVVIAFILALLLASSVLAQIPTLTTTVPLDVYGTSCTSIVSSYPPMLNGYVWRGTLAGRIALNGATVSSVSFQHGPTTSYGQEIVTTAYGTATNGDRVYGADIQVAGFSLYYHYRLKVVTETGTYYGNDLTFVPIYPVCAGFTIERPCSDSPTMAVYSTVNRSPYTITAQFQSNAIQNEIICLPGSINEVYGYKYAVASFQFTVLSETYLLQYLSNNQSCMEDPNQANNVFINPLGRTYWNENGENRNIAIFEIYNRNTIDMPLQILSATSLYSVTVPSMSRVIVFTEDMAELSFNGETFIAANVSTMPWPGIATVTAVAGNSTSNSATFTISNNDAVAHDVKLANTTGLSHSYSLAAYASQTVTIERSNWNLKLLLPNSIEIGSVDNYLTVGTVAPGPSTGISVSPDLLTVPCNSSTRTLSVSNPGSWTATSNQTWATISAGSGSGNASMTVNFATNNSSSRTAMILFVGGDNSRDSVLITQEPLVANALNFDGVDDYISGATNCDTTLANGYTIEAWVNRDGITTPAAIQFISAKGMEQLEIHLNYPSNNFRFIPTTRVYIDATCSLPLNEWVHIACSYNPITAEAHCYVNAVEVPSTNNGSNPLTTSVNRSGAPLTLGKRTYGGYQFKGSIDEYRLWSGIRTREQISANMNTHLIPATNPTLVCSYSFDQGDGGGPNSGRTSVFDATINNYELMLNNFALTGATSNWVTSEAQSGNNTDPLAPASLSAAVTGYNVNLNWLRVNMDTYGNPVTVTNYLIYFRNSNTIPWQFLAYTSGADATSYAHNGVVRFSPSMYYHVTAFSGSGLSSSTDALRALRPGMTKMQVERQLYGRFHTTK